MNQSIAKKNFFTSKTCGTCFWLKKNINKFVTPFKNGLKKDFETKNLIISYLNLIVFYILSLFQIYFL